MPDWDPKHFEKQTLTSGPYPNNSFIGIFDTEAEVTALKAGKGSMAFAIDIGSHGGLMVYNGTAWKQISFTS